MDSFALFTAKGWRRNGTEAIEHGGEVWINQGHLQKTLNLENISVRTQYYSDEFKKMRCKTQACGKYQPCRMFIENTAAVEIKMSAECCKNRNSYF